MSDVTPKNILFLLNSNKSFTVLVRKCNSKMSALQSSKVNSVEEACAKCFVVHVLKSEIFQIT